MIRASKNVWWVMSKGAFNNPATETLDKVIQTEKEKNLLAKKTIVFAFLPRNVETVLSTVHTDKSKIS